MNALFGGPKIAPPPPPPLPPNPPQPANPAMQNVGKAQAMQAAAAQGAGFDNTLLTSGQGAAPATTATKTLTGQ